MSPTPYSALYSTVEDRDKSKDVVAVIVPAFLRRSVVLEPSGFRVKDEFFPLPQYVDLIRKCREYGIKVYAGLRYARVIAIERWMVEQ